MGPLLAGFLSILGAAIDGDLQAWSMGGTPTIAQGGATGPLGNGLIGSHNSSFLSKITFALPKHI